MSRYPMKFDPYTMNAKYRDGIDYLDTAVNNNFIEELRYETKDGRKFLLTPDGNSTNIEVEHTNRREAYYILTCGYYGTNYEVNSIKPVNSNDELTNDIRTIMLYFKSICKDIKAYNFYPDREELEIVFNDMHKEIINMRAIKYNNIIELTVILTEYLTRVNLLNNFLNTLTSI